MNKLFNKILLSTIFLTLSISLANAKNTVCVKENWNSPSTIETTPFQGGECAGKYSIKQMQEMGWRILDIKIDSSKNNFSYKYLLTNEKIVENKQFVKTKKENTPVVNKLSFRPLALKIENIKNNTTTIDVGDLIVGQSGIVLHLHDETRRLIVANAEVISTNKSSSKIKFTDFNDLKQNAIPTSKRKAEVDDILVLNYLYTSSLLIAPTADTFKVIRQNFKYNNFIHSDILASKLKINSEKYPDKEFIQNFAIEQNLGTIFIVVNQKLNVLDTKSFKILASYDISYDEKDNQSPFYTRVEDFEASTLSFFSSNSDLEYEDYYKQLLGLK